MLSAIGFLLKTAALVVFVLLAGHWIRWDGASLSSRVISYAERAHRATSDAIPSVPLPKKAPPPARRAPASDETSATERQKLRQLIRELQGTRVSSRRF